VTYAGDLPMDDTAPSVAASALAESTDPSQSGTFGSVSLTRGRCGACWAKVLSFPALSSTFPLSLVFSLVAAFISAMASPDAFLALGDMGSIPASGARAVPSEAVAGFVITLLVCIVLVAVALLATRQLLYQLYSGQIKAMQIVGMYLSTILLFGDLYLLCLFFDVRSVVFSVALDGGGHANATTNVVSIWVSLVYFSVSTVTCTGYGDITPSYWIPKIMAASELIVSVFYTIVIFSIGLKHFQGKVDEVPSLQETGSLVQQARSRLKNLRAKYPRLDALRKWFIRFVFPVSLLVQLGSSCCT